MKKTLLSIFFIFSSFLVFAQEEKLVKPQKPFNPDAFYVVHGGGISWTRLTRIQLHNDRSNFVWQDDMFGFYYAIQTGNLPVNFLGKISLYYPYHYEFNKVEQIPKQTVLYAGDLDLGPVWTFPLWEICRVNLSPVVHYRYQLSDKYHHNDLGLGALAVMEFPISKRFTILLNSEFSYDCGNLGSNRQIQKFDHVWAYTFDLGLKYTKRHPNNFYYIKTKQERAALVPVKEAKKAERLEKKQEKKTERQQKKDDKKQKMSEYKTQLKEYKEEKKRRADARREQKQAVKD
ncbi:MAG: hypothetical protein K6E69_08680 [Treponema sp.]|uniref:hypothetical protein n=1 Tax=Treponema sp. TaxID=166 RepID=UPI00298E18D3|nr:hypothetical protein [Treponema sp.]MCR5387183.1 hypothetical protein [Treponema sp.]